MKASEDDHGRGADRDPFLIGLLVDVSGSMRKHTMREEQGTRLDSLRAAIDDLVSKARQSSLEAGEDPGTLFHLFAYGFGFGNLLTIFRARNVPAVRNLFAVGEDGDVILDGGELINNWDRYRENIGALANDMMGTTPMVEAFGRAERVIREAARRRRYREHPLLLVLSDGLPTDPPDAGPERVRDAARRLRDEGVVIVSCFVAPDDVTPHRALYATPRPGWSDGARLMFDCASPATGHPVFHAHLAEFGWQVPPGAKLFAQVNQSDLLSEFMQLILSPLGASARADERPAAPGVAETPGEVSVFVSYSHADERYVGDDPESLLRHLRALEDEGVSFWCDRRLRAGDIWDDEIRLRLGRADVALVLVSQSFLTSSYCRTVEAQSFIEQRRSKGLCIVPVILSACDWKRHEWIASAQVMPSRGRNVEQHYTSPGERKALYQEITEQLREIANDIRGRRLPAAPKGGEGA